MAGLDTRVLTAREAKRLLVAGDFSAAELAKLYLDQIEAVEPRVKAFILVTVDNAAKYSTKVDREMQAMRGPLAGLPIAVKDNMVTENVTTTAASRILGNYSRAAPAAARPPPSPPARLSGRWGATRAGPSANRRRCAAWWA